MNARKRHRSPGAQKTSGRGQIILCRSWTCTGARRNPVTCGTNPGDLKRQFAPPLQITSGMNARNRHRSPGAEATPPAQRPEPSGYEPLPIPPHVNFCTQAVDFSLCPPNFKPQASNPKPSPTLSLSLPLSPPLAHQGQRLLLWASDRRSLCIHSNPEI